MRAQCESTESECRGDRGLRVREYKVESAESERVQSREEGAECTMRAKCEVQSRSANSRVKGQECRECENPKSRVQSRECSVESTENARAQSREEGVECTMRSQCEVQRRECNVIVQSRECRVESAM